jgi:hypothetical protein
MWNCETPPCCKGERKRKSRKVLHCGISCSNVGATGFEPATSCSQSRRSNRAELRPEGRAYTQSTKTQRFPTEKRRDSHFDYGLSYVTLTKSGRNGTSRAELRPEDAEKQIPRSKYQEPNKFQGPSTKPKRPRDSHTDSRLGLAAFSPQHAIQHTNSATENQARFKSPPFLRARPSQHDLQDTPWSLQPEPVLPHPVLRSGMPASLAS